MDHLNSQCFSSGSMEHMEPLQWVSELQTRRLQRLMLALLLAAPAVLICLILYIMDFDVPSGESIECQQNLPGSISCIPFFLHATC